MASVGLILLIKEGSETTVASRLPWRAYLPRLGALLRADGEFRSVTLLRLVGGAGGLAAPFYILHATEDLRLSGDAIGFFVSVQVGAGVLLGLLMGYVSERAGSRRVIQLSMIMGLMSPLAALIVPRLVVATSPVLPWAYALVFVGIQGVNSGTVLGFVNFVMEIAPAEEGPTYVGLANTLGALLLIYPLLGGALLERVSYSVLFAVTAAAASLALLLAARLREPQTEPSTA
jgi:MFS family permease